MLTFEEAKKIGIKACIDKIGYEFCLAHKDNSTSAYGEDDGIAKCFVGVSDAPAHEYNIEEVEYLILTHKADWPYFAHCDVDMATGEITFGECKIPE